MCGEAGNLLLMMLAISAAVLAIRMPHILGDFARIKKEEQAEDARKAKWEADRKARVDEALADAEKALQDDFRDLALAAIQRATAAANETCPPKEDPK